MSRFVLKGAELAQKDYVDTELSTQREYMDEQFANAEVLQYEEMPVIDEDGAGQIVQYVGTTDSNYENGYWYKADYYEDTIEVLDSVSVGYGAHVPLSIIPTNHKVEVSFNWPSYFNDSHIIGTDGPDGNWSNTEQDPARFMHFTSYNNRYYWGLNGEELSGGSHQTGDHTIIFNNGEYNELLLDGNIMSTGLSTGNGYPLILFKRSHTANFNGLFYYLKIWDKDNDNELIMDLVPVLINGEEVAFFDRVNIEIYYSTGGTLTAGNTTGEEFIWAHRNWERIDVQPAPDMSNYLGKDNEVAYTPTHTYHPATKNYVDNKISSDLNNYLAKNNTTQYTPSDNYNPATKKYVDDATETVVLDLSFYQPNKIDGETQVIIGSSHAQFNNIKAIMDKVAAGKAPSIMIKCNFYRPKFPYDGSTPVMTTQTIPVTMYEIANNKAQLTVVIPNTYSASAVTQGLNRSITTYKITDYDSFLGGYNLTYSNKTTKQRPAYLDEVLSTQFTNSSYTPTNDYDPATKKYVDDLVSSIETTKRSIVQTLPVSNIDLDTIYMVPKNPNPSHLPSEYQQVEYIKGTGTQYIDTNFVANGGMICNYSVSYENDGAYHEYVVGSHGVSDPYGRNGGYLCDTFGAGERWELGYGDQVDVSYTTIEYNRIYNVEFSTITGNAYLKADGTTLITDNSTEQINSTNVMVFTNQFMLDTGGDRTTAKVYSIKIYNNQNTLVRDYIPCYRKSDNEIGLYDLVNNIFYVNDGTGAFIKGGDVTTPTQSNGVSQPNDVYYEYMYINNTWELIGNTEIDLSDYLSKNNTTPYIPTDDYHPATKAYVDDKIALEIQNAITSALGGSF